MTTVTDLAKTNQLFFRRGVYNIIDCGIRTGKTYWAVNNLQEYTRDGALNRVLYLVDTNALKDQILESYSDTCADADMFWESRQVWGEQINKIGVMCYQKFGNEIISRQASFLNEIDVICWDECDSIFNFAASAFKLARHKDYNRPDKDLSNAEILAVIQGYTSTREYMPLILLGKWEEIINQNRILCIGLSATPERARAYYQALVSASNTGKLEAGYRLADDIYFTNVLDHIKQLQPEPNRGYWCFSPFIEPNQGIVAAARNQGFNAIELHSLNNIDKPMNQEQIRVYDYIVRTGMVPPEYDFIVVNKALVRGITIKDKRFDNIIIDTLEAEDRIQAARQVFKYRRHLRTFCGEIPKRYLNKWITLDECRELAEYLDVPSLDKNNRSTGKTMTWNALKSYLPAVGYTVEQKQKTINKKRAQMCYITGEWHNVEFDDEDFLALVEAKS